MIDLEREQLQTEIASLRLLLGVNGAAALEQARSTDRTFETMRLEAAIRLEQANLVHEIIEASSDAVIVLDNHWEFRYINRRATEDIFSGRNMRRHQPRPRLPRDHPHRLLSALPEGHGRARPRRL